MTTLTPPSTATWPHAQPPAVAQRWSPGNPLVWLALAFILTSGTLAATVLLYQRTQEIHAGERLAESFARVIEEQTSRTLQSTDQGLQLVASRMAQLDTSGTLDQHAIRTLLRDQMRALPFVSSMAVTDRHGTVTCDSEDTPPRRQLADRDYFRTLQSQPQTPFTVGAPQPGDGTGRPQISTARPRISGSGSFDGVLVAVLEATYFDTLWRPSDLGEGVAVALIRRDGLLVLRSPQSGTGPEPTHWNRALLDQALTATAAGALHAALPATGAPGFFAVRPVSGQPGLAVVVAMPLATMLASWHQLAGLTAVVWSAGSAAIIALCLVLGRSRSQTQGMEANARQMAQRLTLATEAAAIGVWDWDLGTGQSFATPTYFSMLGYNAEEGLISRSRWLERVHPDDRAAVDQHIHLALVRPDQPYHYETRMRHVDGSYRWISVTGRVLERDAQGRARRLLGVRIDIDARKRAEEERLQVFERITDAFVALDRRWRYTYVNRKAAQMLGQEPAQLVGQHIWTGYPAGETQQFRSTCERAMATQQQFHLEEYHAPLQRWFENHIYPSADGLTIYFHDITQRKLAEASTRALLVEKEALLQEVHHRVKNNLQVISSLLRLESGRSAQHATRTVLRDMRDRIQTMALLHETLVRSGNFAAVDLGDYLQQLATQSFRALADRPDAVTLTTSLVSAKVDMDQAVPCGLLVNELVSNALKHGFPEGRSGVVRVELRAMECGTRLRLAVSDSGVGLPPDLAARRSAALGLQLASDLAGQIGGPLLVAAGAMTEFAVVFPYPQTRATPPLPAEVA